MDNGVTIQWRGFIFGLWDWWVGEALWRSVKSVHIGWVQHLALDRDGGEWEGFEV